MDPTAIYNDPRLTQAKTAYESATRRATSTESSAMSLPDILKDTLTKKFSQDNPLIQGRERALQGYLQATTQAPLDVAPQLAGGNAPVIYNPLEQANLIQGRRAAATAPLASANYLLDIARGGIGDIIDASSRAAQAETVKQRGAAQIARTSYEDILNELSAKAEAALKQRDFEESVRQFEKEFGLKERELTASLASGGNTATERASSKASAALKAEVAKGTPFYDLYPRYASELPEYEIRNAYNSGPLAKKYGPAKETSAQLLTAMSETKKASPKDDKESKQALSSFQQGLSRLKGQFQGLTALDKLSSIIPGSERVNPKISAINTLKTTLGYDLARLRDKGVLNKQDVDYAINSLGKISATNASAMASLQEVEEYINRKLGVKSSGGGKSNDPLGLF